MHKSEGACDPLVERNYGVRILREVNRQKKFAGLLH
jgi:hypothetical protein